MQLEIIILSEISQTQKENITFSFICSDYTYKMKMEDINVKGDFWKGNQQQGKGEK
jgi:hypothetical protein